MKLLQHILIPLALLSLAACNRYDVEDFLHQQDVAPDSIYIELTFDIAGDQSTVTRSAGPTGGEEGDGWEYGHENENQLHNFTVFVIGWGKGINAEANTAFVGTRYFTDEEVARVDSLREEQLNLKNYDPAVLKDVLTYQFSIPILYSREKMSPEIYRFIVVANNGDLTSLKTVGELREAIPQKTWTDATATEPLPTRFVMSNENDNYYATGTGTEDSPVRLHVTIERMAARIDFLPQGAEQTGDGLRYTISAPASVGTVTAGSTLAYLYVDRIAVINGCQKPSYYIKHVADDISGTNLVYLADETPAPRGVATNYVIDPYSTQKTEARRTDNTFLTSLYGDSRIGNAAALLARDASRLPTVGNTNEAIILGYVNENTFDRGLACAEYATGIIMQCRYQPVENYYTAYDPAQDKTVAGADGPTEQTGLTKGTYEPNTTFYMVEPDTTTISEAQRLYFKNKADAEAYATNTARRHFCKVVEYKDGVCYYVVYLRHSNKVEVIHNTMEFGIVRNNIYRLKINPQTGPGTPTIDPRHPEEQKARIYVRKWVAVEHPIILV